jgi:hypothetical protein
MSRQGKISSVLDSEGRRISHCCGSGVLDRDVAAISGWPSLCSANSTALVDEPRQKRAVVPRVGLLMMSFSRAVFDLLAHMAIFSHINHLVSCQAYPSCVPLVPQ